MFDETFVRPYLSHWKLPGVVPDSLILEEHVE